MKKKRKRAPGGGRKKGSGAGRTVTLGVRVTPEELREVESRADAAGVKVAEYVRRQLLTAASPAPDAARRE